MKLVKRWARYLQRDGIMWLKPTSDGAKAVRIEKEGNGYIVELDYYKATRGSFYRITAKRKARNKKEALKIARYFKERTPKGAYKVKIDGRTHGRMSNEIYNTWAFHFDIHRKKRR